MIDFASGAPICNGRGYDRQQSTDDLAARFIDTLVSTLVEYSPTYVSDSLTLMFDERLRVLTCLYYSCVARERTKFTSKYSTR